jgi:hypothetical protein
LGLRVGRRDRRRASCKGARHTVEDVLEKHFGLII